MMRRTDHDQIIFVVATAGGTRFDVMQIHERRVPAPRHHTAPMIAPHHLASKRWWNRLTRARSAIGDLRRTHSGACAHVGMSRRFEPWAMDYPIDRARFVVPAHVGFAVRFALPRFPIRVRIEVARTDLSAFVTRSRLSSIPSVICDTDRLTRDSSQVLRVTTRHFDDRIVQGSPEATCDQAPPSV